MIKQRIVGTIDGMIKEFLKGFRGKPLQELAKGKGVKRGMKIARGTKLKSPSNKTCGMK